MVDAVAGELLTSSSPDEHATTVEATAPSATTRTTRDAHHRESGRPFLQPGMPASCRRCGDGRDIHQQSTARRS